MNRHPDRQRPDASAPGSLRWVLALSAVATLGFALTANAYSWYRSDDYLAFYDIATKPFAAFVLAPVDVHFIPLHRLVTWILHTTTPFRFEMALLWMGAFHLAAVWLLYRTLELIGHSPLHGPLVALCGTSFYAANLMIFWTAGIARFGYVFFAVAAIYQYLRFRRDGSAARAVAVLLFSVCASAFFSKGLLVCGALGALELVLLPETPRRDVVRNMGLVFVAILVSLAYFLVGSSFGVEGAYRTPPINWTLQQQAFGIATRKVVQSLFGLPVATPYSPLNWAVVVLWGAAMVASVRRDLYNTVVWLVGLCVVFVNFAVISLSVRRMFGPGLIGMDRYYFENLYLIVIFLAVIANRSRARTAPRTAGRARLAVIGTWVVVVLLAANSQARFVRDMNSANYVQNRFSRTFGRNLSGGIDELRRTHDGILRFRDGAVPREVLRFVAIQIGSYARFLKVFGPDVVVARGPCLYEVQADGTILRPDDDCR